MNLISKSVQFNFFCFVCSLLTILLLNCSSNENEGKNNQENSNAGIYRLERITVPVNSKHRKNNKINDPPKLYLRIMKNGEIFGSESDGMKGWEVEFPDKEKNRWIIGNDPDSTFVIQVWDNKTFRFDYMIMSKADIKATDFQEPIFENVSEHLIGSTTKFAIKVEFERIDN